MAEVTLTLDDLKFANVTSFSRDFGTKKLSTVNGGSLTTEEFNIANALPFDKERPYVVTENTTFTSIEYDAKLLVNGSGLTVTLGTATEGITVTISTLYDTTIVYNSTSFSLSAGEICKVMYFNSKWKDQLNDALTAQGKPILLWKNSNPDTSFYAQDIEISNLSSYKTLLIQCAYHSSSSTLKNVNVIPNIQAEKFYVNSNFVVLCYRIIEIDDNIIKFSTGKCFLTYANGNASDSVDYCIPYAIYGIA